MQTDVAKNLHEVLDNLPQECASLLSVNIILMNISKQPIKKDNASSVKVTNKN